MKKIAFLISLLSIFLSGCGNSEPKLLRKLWCWEYSFRDPQSVYCKLYTGDEENSFFEWRGKLTGFYYDAGIGQNTWYEYDNGEHYLVVMK